MLWYFPRGQKRQARRGRPDHRVHTHGDRLDRGTDTRRGGNNVPVTNAESQEVWMSTTGDWFPVLEIPAIEDT